MTAICKNCEHTISRKSCSDLWRHCTWEREASCSKPEPKSEPLSRVQGIELPALDVYECDKEKAKAAWPGSGWGVTAKLFCRERQLLASLERERVLQDELNETKRLRNQDLPLMQSEVSAAHTRYEAAESQLRELIEICKWLLGESGDFPKRLPYAGYYWWRKDLRTKLEKAEGK
jgi:hypothetical protein